MPVASYLSDSELDAINSRLEDAPAEEALRWANQRFAPDIALACSFGGLSGMVLVDMAASLGIECEVFYLDTDLLFPETYQLVEAIRQHYGISPVAYRSELSLAEQAAQHGSELWQRDPDLCCSLRKVEPNRRALAGKKAWMTGIRRDQTANRRDIPIVEWDEKFDLLKLNPLADWTEPELRGYISRHGVPYNALLDRGFPSIGCLPCTRAVRPGEDGRAGRWSGLDKTECGLHLKPVSILSSHSS